ncbi:bifunctional biotin--[acetyl-CoA-carboxylase] ligase/biotin operon repressor BirA [Vibrio sp. Of7-15]|uniref:bifunctional biotin--[acetyl-CoA-carboxylase] ligase/biotin operon repressor BirA n=1 Tax=Vibrio sp. Of7-15 TaxID=2724879 RepID=UPI001EF39F48|nr:bifunctional biotin--[acetyl-CoA-carboxylase] ligase/biotin operon repressor BirA [Vibrio sp. Of7-15]MCG7500179.1 bifunctional biotin--[acetyl-CoA-carboxylase] ligase/biotin operon repressor BirA [Vibrio sp. Of7-15]
MKDHQAKLTLIEQLADGQFHSGEQLGELLGISRAAISKHIKTIQSWGLDVFRVQGKGYCLSSPIELLDIEKIRTYSAAPNLELIPVIDSTNQHLLNKVGDLDSGAVCIAEYQQAGRGRRGRQWESPFGSNLYLSMYWRLDAGMAAAMGLSLVVGVAIAETLQEFGCPDVKVKWPNDIYYQDKKLAGILVELTGQTGDAAHLVIGMGLNISMSNRDEFSIDQPWANMIDACEDMPNRNQLVASLIDKLTATLKEYELVGLPGFLERWNQLDNFQGREVRLIIGNDEIKGVARGINEQGALMLEMEDGIKPFIGGEISLRKAD